MAAFDHEMGPPQSLGDLFSPTLQKKMAQPLSLPFTPMTASTPACFNLFSPHFSPQLNFLLNTPAVRDSMQFSFPTPAPVCNVTKPTVMTSATPKKSAHYATTTAAVVSTSPPAAMVPNMTTSSSPVSEDNHADEYVDYDSDYSSYSETSMGQSMGTRELKKSKMETQHKPARGRQRRAQLMNMTEEEREIEREILMEKSRQSARDCRKRKKNSIEQLRQQLGDFQQQHDSDMSVMTMLRKENAFLLSELQDLRKLVAGEQKKRH
jgi:hypothetical protein